MTTLSKEDTEKLWWQSNQDIFIFAVLARADLVAENERLKASSTIEGCRQMISDLAVKEASDLHDQLTATCTALAAAEARERKLCKAIVLFRNEKAVGRAGSVRATEGYAAMQYAVFDQPRDDSALREMIAGAYDECAKVCLERAANHASEIRENEADNCASAIRALAEKAKVE